MFSYFPGKNVQSTEVSDYEKARATMATLFRAADIANMGGAPSTHSTDRAIRNAELMLDQLGISDPEKTITG